MNQRSRACWRLAAAVSLALAASAGWSAPAPTSGVLRYQVTNRNQLRPKDAPPRIVIRKMDQTLWFKDRRFRVDTVTEAEIAEMQVTLGGPDGMFILRQGKKVATKLPPRAGPPEAIPGQSALGLYDVASVKQYKKVATGKVGSYTTDIYEWSMTPRRPGGAKGPKSSTRVWVSRELPVPVKIVRNYPPHYVETTELKSVQWNVEIPDKMFRLPRGVRVVEMKPNPAVRAAREKEVVTPALTSLRELAAGVLMYSQDHGGSLPPMRDAAALKQALARYVRNPAAFQSPGTGQPFRPNTALAGQKLGGLRNRSRLVILYSAVPERDGTHVVARADGSVRVVSADEWKKLAQEQNLR